MIVRCVLLAAMVLLGGAGCMSSYTVPGGPAQIAGLGAAADDQTVHTDPTLRKYYDAKPLAQFPAMLVTARVQSAAYESRTASAWGGRGGVFSVVTTRDVESDDASKRLAALPMVHGVAPMNRLLLPERLQDADQLREAAARLKADMLLLYTFDTKFYVKDFARPVTIVTLGLSPNKRAYVSTTATAIVMDVRSGYIYGGAEATAKSQQLASGWTTEDAIDDTRLRTEAESFEKLTRAFEGEWTRIVGAYAHPATQAHHPD